LRRILEIIDIVRHEVDNVILYRFDVRLRSQIGELNIDWMKRNISSKLGFIRITCEERIIDGDAWMSLTDQRTMTMLILVAHSALNRVECVQRDWGRRV
jgi:hypothetical protein